MDMHQPLIAHASYRTSGVSAKGLCSFYIIGLQVFLDIFHQLSGFNLRERQVDDTLDTER